MVPLGGQALGRAVTAISPLTRSLERAATLFRTRPLPCHHPLTGNWDGSLISTRSHWLISSRTTEANASRFSAQIAKRWEPGRASNGVKVTIGFTWSGASRLATVGNYGVIESRFGRVRRRFFRRGRSVDNSGENGLMVEKQAVRAAQVRWSTCARRTCYRGKPKRSAWSFLGSLGSPLVSTAPQLLLQTSNCVRNSDRVIAYRPGSK